jgi:hypothetical protein
MKSCWRCCTRWPPANRNGTRTIYRGNPLTTFRAIIAGELSSQAFFSLTFLAFCKITEGIPQRLTR